MYNETIMNQNKELQFISGPTIPTMKVEHDDHRRTIREVAITAPGSPLRRVTSIVVKKPEAGETMDLGNHHHARPEDFTVVAGNPTVTTAHKDRPDEVTVRAMQPGDTITMEPGVAHKFSFADEGELRSTMEGTLEESGTEPHKL